MIDKIFEIFGIFGTIKASAMEINLEKKVGFQKLPQEEIEFLQIQKREKSRIKIFVILMLCLTIIGELTLHYQASTDEDVSVDRHDKENDHSVQGYPSTGC